MRETPCSRPDTDAQACAYALDQSYVLHEISAA